MSANQGLAGLLRFDVLTPPLVVVGLEELHIR